MTSLLRRFKSDTRGQSVIEFALVLPLLLVVVLGVIETSYALLDQHVVTKLTREGSNLISRETTLADAAAVMKSMSGRPVDFNSNSKVIFSVIRRGATSGTNNFNKDILYQRYEYGTLAATSLLSTRGSGSFGTGPEYQANNADTDASLQLTNLPSGILVNAGAMVYVTEIFTKHQLITPFDRFGVKLPNTLYSIAYF
jgi:Flp pilus assembly pilin Flp